jgi:hypothetical protein
MKWSYLSWLLLLLQLGLFAGTAFIAPVLLRPRLTIYLFYSVFAAVLWLAYTIGAMFFDSAVHNDVPGAGYLFIGFVSWFIGTAILGFRAARTGL